jgi:hypothetical protein
MNAPDVLSWDYNTAQWVIAIIVGICLAKIYACVAHHMKYLKKTEYYLPYIVMILELFVMLVFMWFSSPYGYYIVTGSKLGFICRTLTDSLVVIVALVSLPDDDILEKERIDMKDIYVSSKLLRPVIIGVWYVGQIAIAVLFDPLANSLGKLILVIIVTFSIILVGLFSLLLIKVNNKYLLSAIHLVHAIGILLLRTN